MTEDVLVVEIGSESIKWLVAGTTDNGDLATRLGGSRRLGLPTVGDADDGPLNEDFRSSVEETIAHLSTIRRAEGLGAPTVVARQDLWRTPHVAPVIDDLVARHLDAELVVLSAYQEATLGLQAVTAHRLGDDDRSVVVMDLGSASTTLATVDPSSVDAAGKDEVVSFSLPLGGDTVGRDYLTSDPPDPGELSAALSVVELHLDDVRREHNVLASAIEGGAVVGIGGFVQLAAVEIGVDIGAGGHGVDGYVLEHEAAEEVFRVLATEPRADRLHNPGLAADHVDGVVGALCVVVEFFRQFPVDAIEVASADLLDGVAASRFTGGAKLGL